MAKNTPTFDGSKYDMWSVVAMAKCYYELSKVFTSNLPPDLPTDIKQNKELNFNGVASATNRILAIELFFKSILVGRGAAVPKTHNLLSLYLELPEPVRLDIETLFNARVKDIPIQQHRKAFYLFTLGKEYSEAEMARAVQEARSRPDESLSCLLERNKDGFVESRYLFQLASLGKINCFSYEFLLLGILCDVLTERLDELKRKRDIILSYGQVAYNLTYPPFADRSYVFTGQGKFLPATLNTNPGFQSHQKSGILPPTS